MAASAGDLNAPCRTRPDEDHGRNRARRSAQLLRVEHAVSTAAAVRGSGLGALDRAAGVRAGQLVAHPAHVLAREQVVGDRLEHGAHAVREHAHRVVVERRHGATEHVASSGPYSENVTLPPGSPRGGVLTHGTVLAVTSNPNRTSPVKRGVFLGVVAVGWWTINLMLLPSKEGDIAGTLLSNRGSTGVVAVRWNDYQPALMMKGANLKNTFPPTTGDKVSITFDLACTHLGDAGCIVPYTVAQDGGDKAVGIGYKIGVLVPRNVDSAGWSAHVHRFNFHAHVDKDGVRRGLQ